MTPRTLLAIDLSTPRGHLAVMCGDAESQALLYQAEFVSERSHNAQVFAPLAAALAVAGSDLSGIIVGTGPGSYTGVRIAIAAAQGVALSRQVPVNGWPSITVPDLGIASFRVIGDARRGHYYLAEVRDHHLVMPLQLVDAEAARAAVAAGSLVPWISFDAGAPLDLPDVILARPSAERLARTALEFSDDAMQKLASATLEPCYLQEAFITVAKGRGKVPVV